MRNINRIIIHCSATRVNVDFTAKQIDTEHKARGFRCWGYHFYIRKSGEIETMRAVEEMGAHVNGYNADSIGVCYEGGLNKDGKPADTRTEEQKSSLKTLVRDLSKKYNTTIVNGHRDLSPDLDGDGKIEPEEWIKMCPCFEVKSEF